MLLLRKKAKIVTACVVFLVLAVVGMCTERIERDAFIIETVATDDGALYVAEGEAVIDGKININAATRAELTQLDGIGDKLAERIIAYREQNGAFDTIEGIMRVSGISEKKFELLKDDICAD